MSISSFHRHFRAVTTMSPLQYQKRVRLQQARARLLADSEDVAAVGFDVGYNNPSQFSREYPSSRLAHLPDERLAGTLPQQLLAKPSVLEGQPRTYADQWPRIAEILANPTLPNSSHRRCTRAFASGRRWTKARSSRPWSPDNCPALLHPSRVPSRTACSRQRAVPHRRRCSS
jgi:hypothetical protein